MNPFEKRFLAHLRRHKIADGSDSLLVAVSGGADSMALLHLLLSARPVVGYTIAVAHANFGLRGDESDADEQFVRSASLHLGLACHSRQFDTARAAKSSKCSVEQMARLQRYGYFADLCRLFGYTRLATGHHAGDNAETMLFNLFRGTGVTGLRGIREVNGNIIRPLLPFTRSELQGYLEGKGVGWRTDSSNRDTVHDRNFIRHLVVPLIEERFGSKFLPSMERLSEQAVELDDFVENHIARLLQAKPLLDVAGGRLHVAAMLELGPFERKEVLKRALMVRQAPVEGQLLQRLADLLGRQPGRTIQVGRGITVTKKDGFLLFSNQ